ncbi:hypothetical protein [Deinococcus sp.]|uniref:hypothetical protein n=1 Tax=Deinococcus sp. TaxID=47478 RepID=UPI0025F22D6D|nr:hypothetical protein [Deinococcus sp.]
MAPTAPNFRFGKNARIEIAPYTNGTEPAVGDFLNFCLTNQVEVGLTNGSITIDSFCSEGDVEVPDGSQTGILTFGDTTWAEDDLSLKLLENAAFSKNENGQKVHYRIYPVGKAVGKPVWRGLFNAADVKLMIPSKGIIKMIVTPKVQGAPERGTQADAGAFTPVP